MNDAVNNDQKPRGQILVVDDEPDAVKIITTMLEGRGYNCIRAFSGRDALETLQSQLVDVILLDVMMPGMDGLQVCEQLRQDDKLRRIPVILLTALDDMQTRSRGMALGVSEYLTKPINRRELFTRIDAQLHARAIERQLNETAAAVVDSAKLQ